MAFAAGLLLCSVVAAQRLDGYGTSGGKGPTGGIGDTAHPVLQAQSFITDGFVPAVPGTTRQLAAGSAPVFNSTTPAYTSRRKVVVDSTSAGAQQEMLGFGFAWTDSTVDVFNSLEPALLDQLMAELFSPDGNNMGFMRHTIGSSDLSGTPYSYDDNGYYNSDNPNPSLSNFTLGQYGSAMLDLIARMGDYKGDVYLYSAPWSYPAWMKDDDLFIAPSSTNWVNNTLNESYVPQAIQYLTDYVDAFKAKGVIVNGISMQNEPLNYQGGYPTMLLEAGDEANLLNQGLGAAMEQRGVKVMIYDHNTDRPDYPEEVIEDAPNYVDAVAWHCYQSPVANYSVLADFHSSHLSTPQFMTECSNTAVEVGTNNFWIAQNFLPAVRYGASGASFWVLATNPEYGPHSSTGGCTTCSGAIFVNSSTVYEKTIDYYMMGQFSRFIRRGGINHRITSGLEGNGTDWTSQFFAIAVQNPDNGWAVVFLNSFPQDQDIELDFTQSGYSWTGTIPASSVVTWLLPADAILANNGTGYYSSPPYTVIPPTGTLSGLSSRLRPSSLRSGSAFQRSSSASRSSIPFGSASASSVPSASARISSKVAASGSGSASSGVRASSASVSSPSYLTATSTASDVTHQSGSASLSNSIHPSEPANPWPPSFSGVAYGPPITNERPSPTLPPYGNFPPNGHGQGSWAAPSAGAQD